MTTPTQPTSSTPLEHAAPRHAGPPGAIRRLLASGPRGAFLLIVLGLALAGVICGLAWSALAPEVTVTMTELGPLPADEHAAATLVAVDSWYAVLGIAAGVVVGAVLATVFLRHGVLMVLALTVGGCLAGGLAFAVGSLVSNGTLTGTWADQVAVGESATAPLMLHAYGFLLVWPIAVLAPVVPLAWLAWLDDDSDAHGDSAGHDEGEPDGDSEHGIHRLPSQ